MPTIFSKFPTLTKEKFLIEQASYNAKHDTAKTLAKMTTTAPGVVPGVVPCVVSSVVSSVLPSVVPIVVPSVVSSVVPSVVPGVVPGVGPGGVPTTGQAISSKRKKSSQEIPPANEEYEEAHLYLQGKRADKRRKMLASCKGKENAQNFLIKVGGLMLSLFLPGIVDFSYTAMCRYIGEILKNIKDLDKSLTRLRLELSDRTRCLSSMEVVHEAMTKKEGSSEAPSEVSSKKKSREFRISLDVRSIAHIEQLLLSESFKMEQLSLLKTIFTEKITEMRSENPTLADFHLMSS